MVNDELYRYSLIAVIGIRPIGQTFGGFYQQKFPVRIYNTEHTKLSWLVLNNTIVVVRKTHRTEQ